MMEFNWPLYLTDLISNMKFNKNNIEGQDKLIGRRVFHAVSIH